MFFRVLQKTVMMGGAGGAGGAIYLANSIDVNDGLLIKPHKLSEADLPGTISSLEDIELYEKFYGCKFSFVNSWGKNETYEVNEFLNKNKGETWKNRAIVGANKNRETCKNKKVVTLEYRIWKNGSGIVIKQ